MTARLREYRQTLEAIDARVKLSTHHARFNKLRHTTEDSELLQLLSAVLTEIQSSLSKRLEDWEYPPSLSRRAASVEALRAYCEKQLAAGKPQWQVLAERAGWQPPRAESKQHLVNPFTKTQND